MEPKLKQVSETLKEQESAVAKGLAEKEEMEGKVGFSGEQK